MPWVHPDGTPGALREARGGMLPDPPDLPDPAEVTAETGVGGHDTPAHFPTGPIGPGPGVEPAPRSDDPGSAVAGWDLLGRGRRPVPEGARPGCRVAARRTTATTEEDLMGRLTICAVPAADDDDFAAQRPEWDGVDLGLPEPEEDTSGRPL